MIAYRHELRAVYDRLDLPQPLRARVLLELATDLAGLEAELLSAGLPPDEARPLRAGPASVDRRRAAE
jgi:hypothetical protein